MAFREALVGAWCDGLQACTGSGTPTERCGALMPMSEAAVTESTKTGLTIELSLGLPEGRDSSSLGVGRHAYLTQRTPGGE